MPKRATARSRRAIQDFADVDAVRRAWCAMLFDDPSVVVDGLSHEVTHTLSVPPHTHADLIQFDIIAGCGGDVVVGDQRVPVRGTTLLVAYPGQPHGYTLRPGEPPSEVWLVKLRLPSAWRRSGARPLPSVLTGLSPQVALLESLVSFMTCWTKQTVNTAGLAQLAQVLSSWPVHAADVPGVGQDLIPAEGGSPLSRVRRVAHTLAQQVGEQPSLDAMADAAELSPRHFARLFQEEFGCTPHAYVGAHRMDVSRRLLLTPGVSVAQVADQMGFTTPAAFSRWFTRLAGQSPRRFREDPSTF